MKTSIKKNHRICIFSKGLVHDSGQKAEVLSSFLFIKNRSRDDLRFSNTTGILLKKNYVVYWC